VQYTIWRLDPARRAERASAAYLYEQLYRAAPKAEYARRYTELTGLTLPAPPPLPDLPEALARQPVDLPALLAQAEARIASETRAAA
jgi:hypothetical protein